MAKYHINNEGNPGICHAQSGACPFGDDSQHFNTRNDAARYYEAQQIIKTIPRATTKVERSNESFEARNGDTIREGDFVVTSQNNDSHYLAIEIISIRRGAVKGATDGDPYFISKGDIVGKSREGYVGNVAKSTAKKLAAQGVASSPVPAATAPIPMEQALKERVVIYGSSDDLIEVEGKQSIEYNADWDKPDTLVLSDGSRVKIHYQDDGIWRFSGVPTGVQVDRAPEEDDPSNTGPRDEYNLSTYSQRLVLPEGITVLRQVKKKR